MKKQKLVIFGSGDMGQLALYYFSKQTEYQVVAFTLDSAYMMGTEFCDLPVVAFEDVKHHYPPAEHDFFVAMAYGKINAQRKEKYHAAKALGYRMASFVSPHATVLTDKIGDNCFILEDNTIQPFSQIGNNVTLWSGNHIGHHSTIKDHAFLASHIVVSGGVVVGEQVFIGVNATLRDHITIGDRTVVGAGTLILQDAEADGLYIGTSTQRAEVPSSRLSKI